MVWRVNKVIVGINQPYWIPYLGYFGLIGSVDIFVPLDSVQFSRKSWVARNFLMTPRGLKLNTIPLQKASQNKVIRELMIDYSQPWREKTLRFLEHNYKKTVDNVPVFEMVEKWFDAPANSLSEFLVGTIRDVSRGLGFQTTVLGSGYEIDSRENGLRGQETILSICERLGADVYLNLPSGSALYDKQAFMSQGIELRFMPRLTPELPGVEQSHVSTLSHLMELGFDGTRVLIDRLLEDARKERLV